MPVSICIPAHNSEKTLEQTLRSLMAQTYRDLDIAVLDNASTDGTGEIVRRLAAEDPRVRHVRFDQLVSPHENFTRCFAAARHELMAIYHSDDLYLPTIVEQEVSLLERRPEVGAVFTRAGQVDGNGTLLPTPFPMPDAIFPQDVAEFNFTEAFRAVLQYGHIFITPSAMVRTSIYRDEIKRWPHPEFGGSADLYVFLTISKNHKLAVLNRSLMNYRIAAVSCSFNYARQRRARHDIFQTLGYFIENEGAALMRPRDRENYDFLTLKDDINLAISYLIDGEKSYARGLMPRLLQPRLIAAALRYRRHAKFLAFGYGTWFLSLFTLTVGMRRRVQKLRFG